MLKPRRKHKLEVAWEGPFQVVHKVSDVNYMTDVSGKGGSCKLLHVNMLKPFYDRGNLVLMARGGKDKVMGLSRWGKVSKGCTLNEVNLAPCLTKDQQWQVKAILTNFQAIFSTFPGIIES